MRAPEDLAWLRSGVVQVIGPGMGEAFLKLKLKDQARSMQLLASDPELSHLRTLQVCCPTHASCCTTWLSPASWLLHAFPLMGRTST